MKIFDTNKFLKHISKWRDKPSGGIGLHHIDLQNMLYDFSPEHKFSTPKNFNSLHKYFKKVSKNLKYETIFNVFADYRKQKSHQWWFELGFLIVKSNKKEHFFITKFFHDTTGITDPMFGIETNYRIKKFPNPKKLYNIVEEYLFSEEYFPTKIVKTIEDFDGNPIAGTWGTDVNFSSKIGLKEPKLKSGKTHADHSSDYTKNSLRGIKIEDLFYQQAKINFNY